MSLCVKCQRATGLGPAELCIQCRAAQPIVATITEEHVPLTSPMSLKDFKRKMAKMSADKAKSMTVRVVAFGLGTIAQQLLDASVEVLGTGAKSKKKR